MDKVYDIIVLGAGPAGLAAASYAGRARMDTLLIEGTKDGGQIVITNEIENYPGSLEEESGPSLIARMTKQVEKFGADRVTDTIVDVELEGKVKHLKGNHGDYYAKAVVLTTGTYLKARCIYGEVSNHTGPNGLQAANYLTDSLKSHGISMRRFKTGTPARINKRSIDFSKMEVQKGDTEIVPFSFEDEVKDLKQVDCYLTYTNEETHKIIRDNLHRSPLYAGKIEGTGPRYCPSIEDKVVRFSDKPRHQAFVEPVGLDTDEMYIQGLSSSLPEEVQIAFYRTIPGLENAEFTRSAYAIEYDCINPSNLKLSLEYKGIDGLFMAGQTNGTSGYEEAACQGLIAGINASQKIKGKEPVILDRSQGYIGVLIDDIVTKGTNEPYRMMTSRAEYRLLLRQDNADLRLTEIGHEVGLISDERYQKFLNKKANIEKEIQRLKEETVKPTEKVNELLKKYGTTELSTGTKMSELLKRTELDYNKLAPIDENRPELTLQEKEEVEIQIKYEGYIKMQEAQVEKFKKLETKLLPEDLDYEQIKGLSLEARQKLNKFKPRSIGQASRISGVSPADISVLLIYLQVNKNN